MPKAKSASDFNMSETIREILRATPNATSTEVREQLLQRNPGLKINTNSFGVAFYTTRKKLGIRTKGKSAAKKVARVARAAGSTVDFDALKHAAVLLRLVGSAESAIEAIKAVQAVQVK